MHPHLAAFRDLDQEKGAKEEERKKVVKAALAACQKLVISSK